MRDEVREMKVMMVMMMEVMLITKQCVLNSVAGTVLSIFYIPIPLTLMKAL